jgi:ADP-dependent phosphofructokinase/glucokinase
LLGKEIQEKIYERFRDTKDQSRFNEKKDYLEECFEKFAHICDRKNVRPDLEFRSLEDQRKKGFIVDRGEMIEDCQNEIKMQRTIFSQHRESKIRVKKLC